MIHHIRDKTYEWMHRASHARASVWILGIMSFTESSFFPIPPDFLLAPMTAIRRDKWWWYALVTTVTSILGALFGYFIGSVLYHAVAVPIIHAYHLEADMVRVGALFAKHSFLTFFAISWTPIPYKIFTIAGGIFHVPIIPMIVASIFSRGLRFFLIAFLMNIFGERVLKWVYDWFHWVLLGTGCIVGVVVWLLVR